jgi:hypothetical protein
MGERGRIRIADVVGRGIAGQTGITRLIEFVDVRGTSAVAGGIAACAEQQDKKHKSKSHAEPRLKMGRKAKYRLKRHFEANFNTCS